MIYMSVVATGSCVYFNEN